MADRKDAHSELPVDPDREQTGTGASRPQHGQPLLILFVGIGGLLGAAARYAVSLAFPTEDGRWPTGTFIVNIGGAFLLGALLESLARAGPDAGWRQRLRLLLGTGFCGAFTTYSTLAVETDLLKRDHAAGLAAAYILVTVTVGLIATALGIAVAVGHHHLRRTRRGKT